MFKLILIRKNGTTKSLADGLSKGNAIVLQRNMYKLDRKNKFHYGIE